MGQCANVDYSKVIWVAVELFSAHLELVIPLQLNKPYSPYKNWNGVLLWRLAIPLKFKSNFKSRLSKNAVL